MAHSLLPSVHSGVLTADKLLSSFDNHVRHQILEPVGLSEHHHHFGLHLEGPVYYGLEEVLLESDGVVGLIVHVVQNLRHITNTI